MKENDMAINFNDEEKIKTIEKMIKSYKEADKCGISNNDFKNEIEAMEHILSDYKRVLQENEYMHNELDKQQTKINKYAKENEELKKSKITYEKVRDIQEKNKNIVDNNYIPKQKIKDKIEEINKMIAYEHNDAVIIQLGKQKRVLQKLLESEE